MAQLYIQAFNMKQYDLTYGEFNYMNFVPGDFSSSASWNVTFIYGPTNPGGSPVAYFPDDETALAYYKNTAGSSIVSQVNTAIGTSFFTTYDVEWINPSTNKAIINFGASLAVVATTGSYNDLSSKPSIPAAQVQSDWNAVSGLGAVLNKPTIPSVSRTTSTQMLSLVGTGATGTQISATKDSTVRASVSTSTTSTIGGPATSVVTMKICATNDATEGNWTTVGTVESDQTITLAVVLQSVQVVKGQVCADVPATWYVKLVNSGTGTHSEAFVNGQKTIYG